MANPGSATIARDATRATVRCNTSVLRIVELDRHDGGSFAAARRSQRDLFPVLSRVMRMEERSAASSNPYMIPHDGDDTESRLLVSEHSRPAFEGQML